jgi:hypothetical protein
MGGFLRIGRNPRNRRQGHLEKILDLLQNEQSTPMTGASSANAAFAK